MTERITIGPTHDYQRGDVLVLWGVADNELRRVVTHVSPSTLTVRKPRWYERLAWWLVERWQTFMAWMEMRRVVRRMKRG